MDAAPTPLPLEAPPPPEAALALPPRLRRRSAFVAAALGWVVPGCGQVYVGRPLKGLLMLVTIGGLFALGLFLTGFTCVDPYTYGLEFVAHMWIGGGTAAAYWFGRDIVLLDPQPYFEVGRLYAAVAGLLNVVAICDALGGVIDHNEAMATRDELRDDMLWEREYAEATMAAALPTEIPAEMPAAEDARGDDGLAGDVAADLTSDDFTSGDLPSGPTDRPEDAR